MRLPSLAPAESSAFYSTCQRPWIPLLLGETGAAAPSPSFTRYWKLKGPLLTELASGVGERGRDGDPLTTLHPASRASAK